MKMIVALSAMLFATAAQSSPISMQGFACDKPDDVKVIYQAVTSGEKRSLSVFLPMLSSLEGYGLSCWFAFGMKVSRTDKIVSSFTLDDGSVVDVIEFTREGGGAPIYSWSFTKGRGT